VNPIATTAIMARMIRVSRLAASSRCAAMSARISFSVEFTLACMISKSFFRSSNRFAGSRLSGASPMPRT